MRSLVKLLTVLCVLSSGIVMAAAINLDDFDKDVMQAMDDAFKDFEPVLGAKNKAAATSDAEVLIEAYQWTEDYFAKRGDAPDAVKWAQEGRQLIQSAVTSLSSDNYDAAAESARAAAKNCKACHEVYKPALSR